MVICERCANRQTCEYIPYDVECDTRFLDVRDDLMNKAIRTLGFEDKWVVAFCKICETTPRDRKNEMTIAEIHEELKQLGYGIKLEVLTQMTPRELKKFRKDVIKASEMVNDLDLRVTEYEGRLKGIED